jgi:hypothetical protein
VLYSTNGSVGHWTTAGHLDWQAYETIPERAEKGTAVMPPVNSLVKASWAFSGTDFAKREAALGAQPPTAPI